MTTIETGPTWSERLDPRNWTLAWKLVAVGLVPAILALVLGVLRVADQAGAAADLGRSTRLLQVQEQVAGAADALRQERDEAALFVAGNRAGDRGVLEIGFGQADGQIDEMVGAIRGASELDPTTQSALQQTEGELAQLQALRTDATGNPAVDGAQIRARYNQIVQGVDVLDRALLRQLRTPGTAGLADALTAVTDATEQLAVQHTVIGSALRSGTLDPVDASEAAATDAQLAAAFRHYQVALTPDQLARFGNFLDDAANAQRERLKAAVLATPPGRTIAVAPYEWDTAYNGSRAAADRSAELLRGELVGASAAAEEQASNLAGINSVILMLGLLLGIAVAVLIARALIRSLRVLRTAALDVAERRLPQAVDSMRSGETPDVTVDPVPLSGRDEVGQVARAFDAVHGQAVRLAADQAALQSNVSAMFVNLSRRSQALVERQLQLIEQLESNEQDPDQLSNLFQLDHLATRMRRNSENLLVLAGTDLAKRNIAPVPMVDVLRAAVSEIEQYQRIVVQPPPTATIQGRSASDLVHLLAELLDNATNFSPPDSQVVMSTARTPDGSIVVEIADRGVGMADHELSDANQRLAGPSSVDVSASRRMGLFVVGRLAARHGFGVRLASSSTGGPGGGLTALVTVPAHLIPSIEPADARPLGMPQPAAVTTQGTPPQPQRGGGAGVNGTARPGGLSALVAGTDGPANPAGVFDAPARQEGQLFTPSQENNGASANPLPTRRPGSTLRPDGPPLPPTPSERPEPGAQGPDSGDADRGAADRMREIAEQARRDQEAAAEKERTAAAERQGPRNGLHPDSASRDGSSPEPAGATDESAAPQTAEDEGEEQERPEAQAAAEQQAPTDERSAEGPADRSAAPGPQTPPPLPQRTPRPIAQVSPPTMPMPMVGRPPITPDGQPGSASQQGDQQQDEQEGVRPAGQQAGPQRPGPAVQQQGPAQDAAPARPEAQEPAAEPAVEPETESSRKQADQPTGQVREVPQSGQPDQPGWVAGSQGGFQPQEASQQLPQPRPTPRPQPAAPAPASDGLFAPSVPVIGEQGSRGAAEARQAEAFELGETTPIFEEIASAWFRSNRPIPVDWQSTRTDTSRPTESTASGPAPSAPAERAPAERAPADRAPVDRAPADRTPSGPAAPSAPPQPAAALPPSTEQDFATVADEGWRAASEVVADRPDELTAAGLPKRRPRARLVPGSAGSAVLATPVTSTRSAETIRGRLASYQQGVRQGRESRMRGQQGVPPAAPGGSGTGPAGDAGGNHDEESS